MNSFDSEMARKTLTLYQLGYNAETPMSMAPHVWKTLLPLRRLRVKFKSELITLTQLREELPEKLGYTKVTLPVRTIIPRDRFLTDGYIYSIDITDHRGH